MRRPFIASVSILAAIALTVNAQNRTVSKSYSNAQILHVLQQLTFGPKPGDVDAVRATGLKQWIQSQLNPEDIAENPVLEERLKPLATLTLTPSQLMNSGLSLLNGRTVEIKIDAAVKKGLPVTGPGPIPPKMMQPRTLDMDLKDGKLYRAIYSKRQLEEVLVDFWFNHFNVTIAKGGYVADYEREAIRPYVLGKFKDMLVATALHPAMLQYLDNKSSIAPEISQPNGPNYTRTFEGARGLNENFSRELMELHTLGVDG